MSRSLRPSTVSKSLELKNKLDTRNNKGRGASNLQTTKLSQISPEVDTQEKVSVGQDSVSSEEEDYWIDTSAFRFTSTELQSPVTPFPQPPTNSETWSTSVNCFGSNSAITGCVGATAASGSFPPLSPLADSSVVGNPIQTNPVDNLRQSSPQSDSSILEAIKDTRMNDTDYNKKYMELDACTVNIQSLIARFNKDTVSLLDLGTFRQDLNGIFDSFTGFERKYLDLRAKLDRNKEQDVIRLNNLKELHERMKKKVIDNEVQVKSKLQELQVDTTHAATKDADKIAKDKITLKVKHAVNKYKTLKTTIDDLGEVKNMSEHKVRESLVESKEWKKDLRMFQDNKENIDIELLSVEIDDETKTEFNDTYQLMVDAVTAMIKELNEMDKNLGLYALTDSKSKSTVQYPEPFGGVLGENVFKFIKDFEDAISSDHIRKADEVRMLVKYLKGDAKKTIGDHHKTLDSAIDQLRDNYGSPRLIVDKYLREYDKSLGHIRNWGKHGSKERVDAINKTLDFLRNLESLVDDHPDHLKSEVYGSSTLQLLTKGMPHEYSRKLNERCSHKDAYETWFTTIFDIMEENKDTNLSALSTGIGVTKGVTHDHGSSQNKSNHLKYNGHDCTKNSSCKDKWDLLGCIELYKLTSVDDRENFLRERRACFKCGRTPFLVKSQRKHFCTWKNGKLDARCTGKSNSGGRCWKGAAMCSEHQDNASDVLENWLQALKIKFTVNVVVANVESDDSYYDRLRSELLLNPRADKSYNKPVSRDSLQSGDTAQMMDNNEILEFFTGDMRRVRSNAKIHGIPEGDAVFILTVVKGRSGPVMTFVDGGANCWLAQEGVPEREFISVKLDHGPIPLSVAGGNVAYASGEYASLLPLADGSYQCVRGLTLPQVTGSMPEINLVPVFNNIKASAECSDNLRIQNLEIPKKLGGSVDMLLGIRYQNIFPKILHTFPNGLTVFESKLMPASPGALACIGGPIACLDQICETIGASSTLLYMANLTQNLGSFTKIEFFPSNSPCDVVSYGDSMECIGCGAMSVQADLEKFMRLQDSGLDTTYKCPNCRNCKSCLKGSGQELMSMREEFQQQVIEDSVSIDEELGQAVAFLAFLSNPDECLGENEHIAVRRLKNVCQKYSNMPDVKMMILNGFQKLVDRGHIVILDTLDERDRVDILTGSSYTIPWDVNFKEDSLSTPARPTFDASSKTQDGLSLNDTLAKGKANLVNMISMVLNWMVGPIALTGDISQFYNTVLLRKEHWKYQRVVWFPNLDPSQPLIRGIIRTLIYGVRCVSSQTEYVKKLLEIRTRENAVMDIDVKVADFIRDCWYVDDGGTSARTYADAKQLTEGTDMALGSIKMKVKGWTYSYKPPLPEVSDDGVSVGFAGMRWYPQVDSFTLRIQKLHFGKKRRGRFPENLERFDGSFGISLEEFVPEELSRRMVTSVVARIFDPPGFLAPLSLKLKHDLRKLIEADPSWDNQLSSDLRELWISNFKFIEEMRDIKYVRCMVPEDALRPTVRIWLLCDASPSGGLIVCAYSGNERKDGSWSSSLLFAKNLLSPQNWTTPQAELHALSSLGNICHILTQSLNDWVEVIRAGSDSTIALSWVIYEKVRLHVFHRLRVSNVRSKLDMSELFHVEGKQNVSDTGTRPDLLRPDDIVPGSEWMLGKPWMKLDVKEAVDSGVIKHVDDIKMDNEARKAFKEGVLLDTSLNHVNTVDNDPKYVVPKKILEREDFSNYVYPPLRRSFKSLVRITGLVLLAVKKFKRGMVTAKSARNEAVSDGSTIDSLEDPPVRFSVFTACGTYPGSTLSSMFSVNGVSVDLPSGVRFVKLDDRVLSQSLEYIYRKTTAEVIFFNGKRLVDRVGVLVDGILYSKSRIMEDQELRAVGGLEHVVDIESFTGISFKVPIVDRYSPVALSIANHLHFEVIKHRGAETIHRMSLQYVHILGGRTLMKEVRKECIFCQKLLLRHMQQIMGPLSDQQLTVSPIFFFTLIDAWGPLKSFVPGYQKSTRAGSKSHDIYLVVFACAATGMINVQAMEGGKSVACILDVMNRFFNEVAVPKICYVDKDSAIVKVLSEGQIQIISNDGILAKQRGITFETCAAQGHSAHGRVEARIKMLQEALERSDMRGFRLHSLGWQTLAKILEHEVNSIPLGFLHHQDDAAPLLRVLTPNFLKLNAASNRAPKDLFVLPDSGRDLMTRLEDAYRAFFRVWNEDYVPLIAQRQKWHTEVEDLVPSDIVYFKLKDSAISSKWLIGKVEDVVRSRDGKVRKVVIGYKFDTEQGERKFRVVERPVRECVKLLNLEDTTLFDDLKAVRDASRDILGYCVNWHSRHSYPQSQVTYACNGISMEKSYAVCSTDIGHQVVDTACFGQGDDESDFASAECSLGLESDDAGYEIYFDTMNDDTYDEYDKFDDYYDICLL